MDEQKRTVGFFRSLSRPVILCITFSGLFLMAYERMYVRGILGSNLHAARGSILFLLLLPWVYSLRGLWLLHQFAQRHALSQDRDISRLALYLASAPVLAYLLLASGLYFLQ